MGLRSNRTRRVLFFLLDGELLRRWGQKFVLFVEWTAICLRAKLLTSEIKRGWVQDMWCAPYCKSGNLLVCRVGAVFFLGGAGPWLSNLVSKPWRLSHGSEIGFQNAKPRFKF